MLFSKALKISYPECLQRPNLLRPNGAIYQAINADTLRAQNLQTWPFFNQVSLRSKKTTCMKVILSLILQLTSCKSQSPYLIAPATIWIWIWIVHDVSFDFGTRHEKNNFNIAVVETISSTTISYAGHSKLRSCQFQESNRELWFLQNCWIGEYNPRCSCLFIYLHSSCCLAERNFHEQILGFSVLIEVTEFS